MTAYHTLKKPPECGLVALESCLHGGPCSYPAHRIGGVAELHKGMDYGEACDCTVDVLGLFKKVSPAPSIGIDTVRNPAINLRTDCGTRHLNPGLLFNSYPALCPECKRKVLSSLYNTRRRMPNCDRESRRITIQIYIVNPIMRLLGGATTDLMLIHSRDLLLQIILLYIDKGTSATVADRKSVV